MIKEFRKKAIEVVIEENIPHKIKSNYTTGGMWVSDEIWAEELPEKLEKIGYQLSSYTDKHGYHEVFQPQEAYHKEYGHISPEMLEEITK